ncbi:MAG: restriction endonuclease [Anaerolineae bacterium]|nr:restriction endonuclease [Anaerolineae bacterium]
MTELPNVHVPHYPEYSAVRRFLQLMDGQVVGTFMSMRDIIWEHRGTPQETQNWSRPDKWIPSLLQGQELALALHLWEGSNRTVNPRHLTGEWLLCSSYGLIESGVDGILAVTPNGWDFVSRPQSETVQRIDFSEGLLHLLAVIAEHGPGKRSELLPHFASFLDRCSCIRAQATVSFYWYARMRNLTERELVTRSGITYEITQAGLAYLKQVADLLDEQVDPAHDIGRLVKTQADAVRKQVRETLFTIDPYSFETLIQRLLESMGYENVTVTSKSGDGGVDVVADIEVGITLVREVVQVKRRQGSLHRPVLDQLRGSLHRFDAMRGTIITSGRFSRGVQDAAFERGAAPITLIDGDRLIDLLIEHQIGVRKRTIEVLEFEPVDFASEEEPEDL